MFTFEGHNGRVHSVSRDEWAATILIAEDDRRVRDSLDRYLRLEGYEVPAGGRLVRDLPGDGPPGG